MFAVQGNIEFIYFECPFRKPTYRARLCAFLSAITSSIDLYPLLAKSSSKSLEHLRTKEIATKD